MFDFIDSKAENNSIGGKDFDNNLMMQSELIQLRCDRFWLKMNKTLLICKASVVWLAAFILNFLNMINGKVIIWYFS